MPNLRSWWPTYVRVSPPIGPCATLQSGRSGRHGSSRELLWRSKCVHVSHCHRYNEDGTSAEARHRAPPGNGRGTPGRGARAQSGNVCPTHLIPRGREPDRMTMRSSSGGGATGAASPRSAFRRPNATVNSPICVVRDGRCGSRQRVYAGDHALAYDLLASNAMAPPEIERGKAIDAELRRADELLETLRRRRAALGIATARTRCGRSADVYRLLRDRTGGHL